MLSPTTRSVVLELLSKSNSSSLKLETERWCQSAAANLVQNRSLQQNLQLQIMQDHGK